ncbi:MAG: hypothetical protein A2Z20_06615 [Bdellovibrionales bacterium RBG_16_40_8]|nr:MAG: hypothetical protein A2Z20_06615 [Bdellovibrionales bacterium RBG_16_40_8]
MASRTSLAILWISSFALIGCAIFNTPADEIFTRPLSEVYDVPYDDVWRATQKALANYPIQINNIDQGVIETDVIRGDKVWRLPLTSQNQPVSWRYQLQVKIIKGKIESKPSTQVSIFKRISKEKDFFSGEELLPSDGFEEKAILYRISRELLLERSLKRAYERHNN